MSWSIGRRSDGEPIAHGSGQTLGVRYWRGWMWVMGRKVLALEYHARRALAIGAAVTVDGSEDHDLVLHVNVLGLAVWLHLGVLPRRVRTYRQTKLELTRRGVYWALWNSWGGSERSGFFSPRDRIMRRLFGLEHLHENAVADRTRVVVPMPEGPYPGDIVTRRYVYRRHRWPAAVGSRVIVASSFKPDRPIPTPGNMESDFYDGEDGIWGCGVPDGRLEDQVAHVVAVALRERRRHGGSLDWRPRERVAA